MRNLLDDVIAAHGGLEAWTRFSKMRASILIEGEIPRKYDGLLPFADGTYEMLTQEESVSIIPRLSGAKRSTFHRNALTLSAAAGEVIETQYNPRPSFMQIEPLATLDDFHRAYICSYSVWASLVQPFLFAYRGFETKEIDPIRSGQETFRRLRIDFPPHISSHSRQMICYVGADNLMRRQDIRFEVLGNMDVTSVLSNYREVQGIMVPMSRRMRKSGLDAERDEGSLLASISVLDLKFG